jgi:hypothetical protein
MGDPSVHPTGSKMFPTQMERNMRSVGTAQGQLDYPNEEHMQANDTGQPRFKFAEHLSAQQLKAYASQTRSKLLKQQQNLIQKEAREAEKRQRDVDDPQRGRVET